jgi:hypothetical protein
MASSTTNLTTHQTPPYTDPLMEPCAVGDPVQDVRHWHISTVAFDEGVSSVLTFTTALVANHCDDLRWVGGRGERTLRHSKIHLASRDPIIAGDTEGVRWKLDAPSLSGVDRQSPRCSDHHE